ncbi:MAG: leucine-rich repeat domain-containing protein [Promethearchaeota archaeon]
MAGKEFNVNEYITLKLEKGETRIYVNGTKFDEYKSLLRNVPAGINPHFDNVESIDDIVRELVYLNDMYISGVSAISDETAFWGHCSNLQAWAEHDYDTRLLHMKLAFPLLKLLNEAGDPIAKKAFKEEIAKRINSNYFPVILYMVEQGYLKHFNEQEIKSLFPQLEFVKYKKRKIPVFKGILNFLGKNVRDINKIKDLDKLTSLQYLNLHGNMLKKLPESIGNHVLLRHLDLGYNQLWILPESISNLKSLEMLDLENNELTELPKGIGTLTSLKCLCISHNLIKSLPTSFGNLKLLQELEIYDNWFKELPEQIGNLTSLQFLSLGDNDLKTLPISIGNLTSLEQLYLERNKLISLPESIGNLKALKILHLNGNKLRNLPESIGNLKLIQQLNLKNNKLISLPNSIGALKSLRYLDLRKNRLKTIPESILNLTSLEELRFNRDSFGKNLDSRTKSILERLEQRGF